MGLWSFGHLFLEFLEAGGHAREHLIPGKRGLITVYMSYIEMEDDYIVQVLPYMDIGCNNLAEFSHRERGFPKVEQGMVPMIEEALSFGPGFECTHVETTFFDEEKTREVWVKKPHPQTFTLPSYSMRLKKGQDEPVLEFDYQIKFIDDKQQIKKCHISQRVPILSIKDCTKENQEPPRKRSRHDSPLAYLLSDTQDNKDTSNTKDMILQSTVFLMLYLSQIVSTITGLPWILYNNFASEERQGFDTQEEKHLIDELLTKGPANIKKKNEKDSMHRILTYAWTLISTCKCAKKAHLQMENQSTWMQPIRESNLVKQASVNNGCTDDCQRYLFNGIHSKRCYKKHMAYHKQQSQAKRYIKNGVVGSKKVTKSRAEPKGWRVECKECHRKFKYESVLQEHMQYHRIMLDMEDEQVVQEEVGRKEAEPSKKKTLEVRTAHSGRQKGDRKDKGEEKELEESGGCGEKWRMDKNSDKPKTNQKWYNAKWEESLSNHPAIGYRKRHCQLSVKR